MRRRKPPYTVLFDRWAGTYESSLRAYDYQVPQRLFDAVWPLLAA